VHVIKLFKEISNKISIQRVLRWWCYSWLNILNSKTMIMYLNSGWF